MSNSKFIEQQEILKSQGKDYIELTPEQKANMIRMEQEAKQALENGINKTVIKNLLGQGQADRDKRKESYQQKEKELGRKLTKDERETLDKELAHGKAYEIHKENLANAGNQTMMYAMGSAILFMIKPLYFEMKDSILNGFIEGVNAYTYKDAFSIRFGRVKEYVWNQISDLGNAFSSIMDNLKNLISAILEA